MYLVKFKCLWGAGIVNIFDLITCSLILVENVMLYYYKLREGEHQDESGFQSFTMNQTDRRMSHIMFVMFQMIIILQLITLFNLMVHWLPG